MTLSERNALSHIITYLQTKLKIMCVKLGLVIILQNAAWHQGRWKKSDFERNNEDFMTNLPLVIELYGISTAYRKLANEIIVHNSRGSVIN